MKISEASSHQTASRPVGIPVAERLVAKGPCIDIVISQRVIQGRTKVLPLFIISCDQAYFEAKSRPYCQEHCTRKAHGTRWEVLQSFRGEEAMELSILVC